MNHLAEVLLPVALLIAAGFFMRRYHFPGSDTQTSDAFWKGAENLNYSFLFPALLFVSLASAPLNGSNIGTLYYAAASSLGLGFILLVLARFIRHWPAARFGVYLQGILRFNTYIGLAVAGAIYANEGLQTAAIVLSVLVPVVNVMSVWALLSDGETHPLALLKPLAKNPLILACLAGLALNFSGFGLWPGIQRLLELLAHASLPLGLLTVGAALNIKAMRHEITPLLSNSLLRLLAMPMLAFAVARVFNLPTLETFVLVLFFSLPTAPTSFVLTRKLNGEAELMAGVITLQTILSALTLTVVLAVL
ncbi:MAG: transporter [Oceanospirillaceae bacterium]|uniref:AEC family transporter n=1 Tax=unclassified Thalassolituus TaxID=2624967 RepID=UPI000C4526C8|nr:MULTISPECIES: AEC family transporter [unclassified Thalassolituus]MAY01188.1 transporter [Oceanospirillaceae bacterium]MBS52306.1 transporter [Oceanospirillaceae bacterium]|tara:strand:- start:1888 stop:2808 length:921 start_codon:yes stop_codon:yes gene_type:complete